MSEPSGSELGNWRDLDPGERRQWWEQLWLSAIALADRYRLALRSGWWQDQIQVEALSAFAAWVELYDTTTYTDPPGKLQLLSELDRLRTILRSGDSAFDPSRDRPAFQQHLTTGGGQDLDDPSATPDNQKTESRRQLAAELAVLADRRAELEQRERALQEAAGRADRRKNDTHATADLGAIRQAVKELGGEERALQDALDRLGDG
ncbi:MAG: hypothetical protein ACRDL5_00445 [Solirubrobacteraceae bacterium]